MRVCVCECACVYLWIPQNVWAVCGRRLAGSYKLDNMKFLQIIAITCPIIRSLRSRHSKPHRK